MFELIVTHAQSKLKYIAQHRKKKLSEVTEKAEELKAFVRTLFLNGMFCCFSYLFIFYAKRLHKVIYS